MKILSSTRGRWNITHYLMLYIRFKYLKKMKVERSFEKIVPCKYCVEIKYSSKPIPSEQMYSYISKTNHYFCHLSRNVILVSWNDLFATKREHGFSLIVNTTENLLLIAKWAIVLIHLRNVNFRPTKDNCLFKEAQRGKSWQR